MKPMERIRSLKTEVWDDPRKRRRAIRLAIVVAAVVAFVVIPGRIANESGFMARYDHYTDEVSAWEESVHAKVGCDTCHVPPGTFDQLAHDARMLGEFYVSTVLRSREPDILGTPVNEACADCHVDLRTVSPSGDLNIPHRAHVDVLDVDCVHCHEFLVHETNPEGTHAPRMEMCMECHDGEQAKDACAVCHTAKAAPETHQQADWLVVHPEEQDEECEECHAWVDDWCVECHGREPVSHEGKWRSNHRFAVEERRNCEACHEGEFCVECHGVVPQLNFDPTLSLVE
jgi:hypothetical protein